MSVCLGHVVRLVLATSLTMAVAVPARAQVAAGELTGVVTDSTGAALPGVTVTVTNVGTGQPRVSVSGAEGGYRAVNLRRGTYGIDAELSGFTPYRREGLAIATGQKVRVDVTMAVGPAREEVTVKAETPVLRTETASLGSVIEHSQVVQ